MPSVAPTVAQILVQWLGGKCWECGETDLEVLQLHHVNNDGAFDREIHQNGKIYRYYLLRPDEARKNLQVLCANHNWKRRGAQDSFELIEPQIEERISPYRKQKELLMDAAKTFGNGPNCSFDRNAVTEWLLQTGEFSDKSAVDGLFDRMFREGLIYHQSGEIWARA